MPALLRSRLAVRLALLFLLVSLTPILGAAWLFSQSSEEAARVERERRQRLLAERCAALVEEHVTRAHDKLRTVGRFLVADARMSVSGKKMNTRERDDLVARLQSRVEPEDAFLELQFYSGGVEPEILAQARQQEFEAVQQLRPDASERNLAQIQSNAAAPLVQAPLQQGKDWRDEKLVTIEGYPT